MSIAYVHIDNDDDRNVEHVVEVDIQMMYNVNLLTIKFGNGNE